MLFRSGLEKQHPSIVNAIRVAYSKNILMFAAAFNNSENGFVTFPAEMDEVFCIYSANAKGNNYRCNPRSKENFYYFATLGEALKSAWLMKLQMGPSPERRMSGTSVATPVAAGIAACLLEFAIIWGMSNELYRSLHTHQSMRTVFAKLLVERNRRFDYICPWKLFTESRKPRDIFCLIEDVLENSAN